MRKEASSAGIYIYRSWRIVVRGRRETEEVTRKEASEKAELEASSSRRRST